MSPNRRILLNIAATYGRSLYALVCGLFISRCVLAALGKSEIGLCGVVGGMIAGEYNEAWAQHELENLRYYFDRHSIGF